MELITHPRYYPSHYFIYGPGGTYKSTLASSFPKPMMVIFADSFGKDIPYLSRGVYTDYDQSPNGLLYREVFSKKDNSKKLIDIFYVHDIDPSDPEGFDTFEYLVDHYDQDKYKTLVIDSYTSVEYMAAVKAELLPHKEEDGWFVPKTVKQFMLPFFRSKFLKIKTNLVLLGHISRDKVKSDGVDTMITFLYSPQAVGGIKEDITRVFPETYAVRVIKEGGEKKVILQTEIDSKYSACSQIHAPNEMEMTRETNYKMLWGNFNE